MNLFEIKEQPKVYDVVIVGSGAGGGMAAYQLAKAGAKVCLLEAGGYFDPADPKYITQMKNPWESPRRGASTRHRPFGDFDAAWGGWDIEGEPYTAAAGTQFRWFRSRMLGGRTNHWGRISMRFGPDDFKRGSLTGIGDDWPIDYEDLAPYYDKVDKMIGLFGTKEGIRNEPDGIFLPPPKPRLHELMIKKAATGIGIPVIPSRMAMLTKPINDSRGSCFYCGQCGRACQAYADFSASSVLCIPAAKTGNLTLINNAMVREVLTDANTGLTTGVSYVNKMDLKEYSIKGKIVVLAASTCETARILLNSKSSRFQKGLANDSGVVGKYLNDSTGASRSAFIPALMDRKRYNEDGVGGMHVFTPWWLDNKKLDFPRGYHIEYGGGMGMPGGGFGGGIERVNGLYTDKNGNKKRAGGYGAALKEDVIRTYGAYIGMAGRGEPIPLESNYCEIDPNNVDKYGIPTLRYNYKWSENEIKQAKHMQDTFEQIIHSMGGIALGKKPDASNNYGLAQPGEIIHEVGTVRMGNDPKKSALNKWQQAHDVKNLFVVDAAPFVSQGDKNVTWTILASSWRTSDYIIEQVKAKNL
ncbi:fumarate reductase/succinate dehydrogenase flavoprotein domain protein [Emticicia oligotrophica DSM 17448]|uniref:Fumarate reductase/succinate dehydrogenase flavoprotein domain protein n=1 Tax=Emticicia oligotrophica (strain DSM 17448 / CIP 109782 / MTCC 6937 / GPTSA100-15) TaxID=929562 RepID=A0ABM5N138_EMTOG|nr:GMC family oxidoreductase [Emticicia oligotrophica]AFK03024.1 fumarate reductase/succinate dehydrogenase flavoprotein domain protein [Emticicia oligotrophica DSM 17448]